MAIYKFTDFSPQELEMFRQEKLDSKHSRTCCLMDSSGREPLRVLQKPPIVPLEIIKHQDAPAFELDQNPGLIFQQLIAELKGDNEVYNKEFKDLLRQAGLVNLWFYLKYIASYSGPYGDLTDHLHRDMCNFRQTGLRPGSKLASFIGRSHYKSTTQTHGANGWELIRNPNLRIGLGSNIIDRSEEFMRMTQKQFDDNAMVEWLYPEFCPRKSQKTGKVLASRWNSREMVMPNRSHNLPEASIKPIAVGGSTAGNHFDLLDLDDIVGDKQLDAAHQSGTEMEKINNWFQSSQRTLLTDWTTGRINLSATRYAIDDPYEYVMQNVRTSWGNWDEIPYQPIPKGTWDVYYRCAIEKGEIIFPEALTKEGLEETRRDHWWTYVTQYLNNPHLASTSEWTDFDLKKVQIDYTEEFGHRIWLPMQEKPLYVQDMDVQIGIDPAASEKKARANTSQSAICVVARDHKNRFFLLDVHAGYWKTSKLFDEMFRLFKKYRRYRPSSWLEQMGAFKLLGPLLREQQVERGENINFRPVTKTGDKDGVIRTNLEPHLNDGRMYITESNYDRVIHQVRTFPNGALKDILDSISLAIQGTHRPPSMDELERRAEYRQRQHYNIGSRSNITGY